MYTRSLIAVAALLSMVPVAFAGDVTPLVAKIGTPRGLCVVLGDPQGSLALDLARATELTVFLQLQRDEDVAAARKLLDAAGLLGTRVYVQKGTAAHINLADNL